jgi:hypothetical protein
MAFRFGEIRDERFNENCALPLSNEGGGCSTNCFGARYFHGPKEEFSKLDNNPLQNPIIVQKLHTGDEKDNGRDNSNEKPA